MRRPSLWAAMMKETRGVTVPFSTGRFLMRERAINARGWPGCQSKRQPLAEVGRGFGPDLVGLGQATPPAAEEARLRSGHSLERNFLRKDRVAQPKKRKGGGNPIEARPNEDRHEDKSDEILQHFAAAGHLELAVMPGDGLGDGRRVREDDAARSTRDVLPAAEAEDTDIANRS